MAPSISYIILSGGRSTRLGSDKASVLLNGETLLARTINRLPHESVKVVVGDQVAGIDGVSWVREEPLYSGPVSAISAALRSIATELVGLLAVDMPFGTSVLKELVERDFDEFDALIPLDGEEFPQSLSALYKVHALQAALAALEPVANRSMRELLAQLNYKGVRLGRELADKLIDIDTPSDLEKVRNARVD